MRIHQKKCRGSDHFVYIRGKWLNRGYMYIVKISSLVLYMCIYISKKYLVHIAEFETGVLWQNRCIAIDTARNPSKKTYEQLFEAKSRKVNCKGMENTDWIFPSLSYSLFYCFKSNKNLYRSLKIILKVWNFLWRSLDIDPDIHVMFFITTPLKQDYYLGSLGYNTIYL